MMPTNFDQTWRMYRLDGIFSFLFRANHTTNGIRYSSCNIINRKNLSSSMIKVGGKGWGCHFWLEQNDPKRRVKHRSDIEILPFNKQNQQHLLLLFYWCFKAFQGEKKTEGFYHTEGKHRLSHNITDRRTDKTGFLI